jgi:acyl carrier protein
MEHGNKGLEGEGMSMDSNNKARLVEIFRIVLDIEHDAEIEALRRLSEPRWDSLAHTSIVAAIESEFNLEFDIEDMERMTSFQATCLLLDEKGL